MVKLIIIDLKQFHVLLYIDICTIKNVTTIYIDLVHSIFTFTSKEKWI